MWEEDHWNLGIFPSATRKGLRGIRNGEEGYSAEEVRENGGVATLGSGSGFDLGNLGFLTALVSGLSLGSGEGGASFCVSLSDCRGSSSDSDTCKLSAVRSVRAVLRRFSLVQSQLKCHGLQVNLEKPVNCLRHQLCSLVHYEVWANPLAIR